jgi:hypothetical protein
MARPNVPLMPHPTPRPSRFRGPPRIALVWLAVIMVSSVAAHELGAPPGYLISIGAALLVGVTVAVLSPALQELGRRQPRLVVTVAEAGPHEPATIIAPRLPPWPVDVERVIANEVVEAEATIQVGGSLSALNMVSAGPLAVPPSKQDHERARDNFKASLTRYEEELGDWLRDYHDAAIASFETFELTIRLLNASSSAHAEGVTVVLELPLTVSETDEVPTFEPPPERPSYQPPRPRSFGELRFDRQYLPLVRPGINMLPTIPRLNVNSQKPCWTASAEGRSLQAGVGEVHAGRTVAVATPLLLRVRGVGTHQIRWHAYTRSARRAADGVLTLVVPAGDPARPAFGRLEGVISYPDVDLVGDDTGEVIVAARTSDPLARPSDVRHGTDLLDRLRESRALMDWLALGLDPATDGAMSTGGVRPVSRTN